MTLWAIFAVPLTLAAAPMPDSNVGVAPVCTVAGQVVEVKEAARVARVRLLRIHGASTLTACGQTGAGAMIGQGQIVSVSLAVDPKPTLSIGDIALVQLPNAALETFPPASLNIDAVSKLSQLGWDSTAQREELLYQVKTFIGTTKAVTRLTETLDKAGYDGNTKKERADAAVLLIELVLDKQPVPESSKRKAFLVALMDSYRARDIGKQIGLVKSGIPGLVKDLGSLLDKTAPPLNLPAATDPYGIIIALGELGAVSKPALPSVLARMNRERGTGDGDDLFASAIRQMQARDEAAQAFLDIVKAQQLISKDGPLARGMCLLASSDQEFRGRLKLKEWCEARK